MNAKSKGTNAERDLVHKFWERRWACARIAGSGSSSYPSPDLVAGNGFKRLAIEVKICAKDRQYFSGKEIQELRLFSKLFGAESWVAVKFARKKWCFLMLEDLDVSGSSFVVYPALCESKGLSFEELTSQDFGL